MLSLLVKGVLKNVALIAVAVGAAVVAVVLSSKDDKKSKRHKSRKPIKHSEYDDEEPTRYYNGQYLTEDGIRDRKRKEMEDDDDAKSSRDREERDHGDWIYND